MCALLIYLLEIEINFVVITWNKRCFLRGIVDDSNEIKNLFLFSTVAAAIKDLRSTALQFMASMVRHCTLITISQQCGK